MNILKRQQKNKSSNYLLLTVGLALIGLFSQWNMRSYDQADDKKLVAIVEKSFYQNLKVIDKEQHGTWTSRFKQMFKGQRSSPYQLYQEFVEIKRKSKKEATQKAVATGHKERMYYLFIGRIEDQYRVELMNRYRMSIDMRNVFRSNYCSCYRGKIDNYCMDGICKLNGGIDWQ